MPWIPNEYIDVCKSLFLEDCKYHGLQNKNYECVSDTSNSSHTTNNDYLCNYFEQNSLPVNENERNIGLVQGLLHLDSKNRSLNSLHKYKLIKNIFLKYNTTLPSSAPVERIFNAGNQILCPTRNRLTDDDFEILLYLKKNKSLRIYDI